MPVVKIVAGPIVVELDANEISITELRGQALDTLRQIHEVELAAILARTVEIGGYL